MEITEKSQEIHTALTTSAQRLTNVNKMLVDINSELTQVQQLMGVIPLTAANSELAGTNFEMEAEGDAVNPLKRNHPTDTNSVSELEIDSESVPKKRRLNNEK